MILNKKHILFTGGTGGLAKATIKELLVQDIGHITIAGHTKTKVEAIRQTLINELDIEIETRSASLLVLTCQTQPSLKPAFNVLQTHLLISSA